MPINEYQLIFFVEVVTAWIKDNVELTANERTLIEKINNVAYEKLLEG